jgi:hypothetical protein
MREFCDDEYEMSRQGSGASRTDAHLAERHVF